MIYDKWIKAWTEADVATYKSLHHEDWEFKFIQLGILCDLGTCPTSN